MSVLPGEEKGRQKEVKGEERRGGGVGRLVFKNREKRGRRRRGADRQERRSRGGGEGRLAGWLVGWRRGWVVSVERGAGAGLKTAQVQVII